MTKFPIPDAALDDRLAILGTAGSGKTYLALTAVERLLARAARVVLIDPLGVGWGLRLQADGKTASPFNVPIFGGAHGDIGLTEHAGGIIGETVAKMRESCIIDLSGIGTKAGERRFMLAFLTALYRNATKDPVHLILDEADMFAPQKLMDRDGDAARLLGMMETIVRRGRVAGFIPWLITQRPAVLSKDVLSQADGLVALKLTSSQDRDAIGAWIEGQADKADAKAILASLPGMERGQGVVWLPGRSILETARFPAKTTFDSSRTPKRGEKRQAAELKPLDLGALKDRLATVEAETKANDPKALRFEIGKLKGEIGKLTASQPVGKINTADQKATEQAIAAARAEGREEGYLVGHHVGAGLYRVAVKWASDQADNQLKLFRNALLGSIGEADGLCSAQEFTEEGAGFNGIGGEAILRKLRKGGASPAQARAPAAVTTAVPRPVPSPTRAPSGPPPVHGDLKPALQRAIDAIAWWRKIGKDRIERDRAAVVAGYSPRASTFGVYIAELAQRGLVEVTPGFVALTPDGWLLANKPEAATAEDLRTMARGLLSPQEQRVFDVVYEARGEPIRRDAVAEAVGLSPKASTCGVYIAGVAAYGIIEAAGPGQVRAADWLFPW